LTVPEANTASGLAAIEQLKKEDFVRFQVTPGRR